MKEQAVSALQNAFKENGIETRKLPRAAALRVSFMGSFFRVTHVGEGKGWLVNGYNETGDPVKLSELRSLCDELSPVAIAPATDEAAEVAIGNSELINQILSLSSQLGAEAVVSEEGVYRELTSLALPDCSISELNFILGRLEELAGITTNSPAKDDAIAPPTDQITGRALTLQQPWAWAITHLGKNIENRVWPTDYRGELYIHAGKGWDANGAAWIEQNFGVKVPSQNEMASGELVAKCNLANCQHWTKTVEQGGHPGTDYRRIWWQSFGYHWFLEDIEVLETPIPLRGKLGIFTFSVVNPKVMDPHDVDSNAWCVANAPIADDEIIVDFGVPGTTIGGLTVSPTIESAVRRRYLTGRIHDLARRTGVKVSEQESEILGDPEDCPMADLEKLLNQLLTLPPVEDRNNWWQGHQSWWRSRQDDDPDDDGEPINYRPSAEIAS